MKTEFKNRTLTVYLTGELDHHAAKAMREAADDALLRLRPAALVLDFGGVTFMDSSGVGLVMGRYKTAKALGCVTSVRGLKARDKKIMAMSGIDRLVTFQ